MDPAWPHVEETVQGNIQKLQHGLNKGWGFAFSKSFFAPYSDVICSQRSNDTCKDKEESHTVQTDRSEWLKL